MGFLDLIFPRRCVGCGNEGSYFCPACLLALQTVTQCCPVCERPAINGFTHIRCQAKNSLDGLISLYAYSGVMKKAIAKFKYQLVSDLANNLAKLMVKQIEEQRIAAPFFSKKSSWLLIPIPLHFSRQRRRGFNQSEILGDRLADFFGWQKTKGVLWRRKPTIPQAELKSDDRRQNIRGAFVVNPAAKSLLAASPIIIFDDVWTTGSTIKEATKVLKRAGADKVWGLTLAR